MLICVYILYIHTICMHLIKCINKTSFILIGFLICIVFRDDHVVLYNQLAGLSLRITISPVLNIP